MKRMGFTDDYARAYIIHDDPDGQHLHIIASRVSINGDVYLGQNENLKSTKIVEQLERDHNLQITRGSDHVNDRAALKKNEIERGMRTGEAPPKLKLQQIIDGALKDKPSAVEFCERLETAGVRVTPNIASTGKLNGFSFEIDGVNYKGSQLGPAYSYTKGLKERVDYEQNRDYAALRSRADSARVADSAEHHGAADEHERVAEPAPAPAQPAQRDSAERSADAERARHDEREAGRDPDTAALEPRPDERAANNQSSRGHAHASGDDEPRLADDQRARADTDSVTRYSDGRGKDAQSADRRSQVSTREHDAERRSVADGSQGGAQPGLDKPAPGPDHGSADERGSSGDWRARFRAASRQRQRTDDRAGPGVASAARAGDGARARIAETDRQQARALDPTAYLESRGYAVKRAGSSYSVRDSHGDEQYRIDYDAGRGWLWCDKYGNRGGDNIDLVTEIDGKTGYAESVHRLSGSPRVSARPAPAPPPPRPRLVMPKQLDGERNRGSWYLNKERGIDHRSIVAAEESGMLKYGDGAVLYVGRDSTGAARSVTRRAIDERDGMQKSDLRGSEKRYAPVLPGDKDRVWVVEGGTDALATHSMHLWHDKEPPTIIVTGGAGSRGWIEQHADILRRAKTVVIARDREKDPSTQERTDAMHDEQERRVKAVAPGAEVKAWRPASEKARDMADEARIWRDKHEHEMEIVRVRVPGYGR